MARKKYRRGGTSISFKSIGQGLRASEERLKEKAQTEIVFPLPKQFQPKQLTTKISWL